MNRFASGALILATGAALFASSLPAFAQSAPTAADPKLAAMLPPASTFGDGWQEVDKKVDATKAGVGFVPAGATAPKGGGPPSTAMAFVSLENYPSSAKLDEDYKALAGMVVAFDGKSEPAPQYGDRALKVTVPFKDDKNPANNAFASGYLWTVGPTTIVVVGAFSKDAAEAEKLAARGAEAEKGLTGGAAAPAPAPPKKPVPTPVPAGHTQDEAKSSSIGLDAFPKGWALDSVKPSSAPGGEYDAVYKPTDPSSKIISAEVDVFIPNDTSQMDKMLTTVLSGARQAGWSAAPSDYYGDRAGVSAMMGTADQAGYLYVFAVDDTLVAVTVLAKPEGADDAADLADQLATAQEAFLQ